MTTPPTSNKALTIGRTSTTGAVDVYRDGDVVTVVMRGEGVKNTPDGQVRTTVGATRQYDSIAAYENDLDRVRTNKRFALAYQKVVDHLGVEEDARLAPPLPAELRHLLPEHLRALPSEASSKPSNLFLLPRVSGGGRR